MNIMVRNIDPQYIREIDKKCAEISQKRGSKFSRNDYLKQLLRQDSEIDLIDYRKSEFDEMLDKLLLEAEKTNRNVSELTETYQRVFDLLMNIISDNGAEENG